MSAIKTEIGMSTKIENCPYCGLGAWFCTRPGRVEVSCYGDKCRLGCVEEPTLEQAIQKWNKQARCIKEAPTMLATIQQLLSLFDDPCPYDAATTRGHARNLVKRIEGNINDA